VGKFIWCLLEAVSFDLGIAPLDFGAFLAGEVAMPFVSCSSWLRCWLEVPVLVELVTAGPGEIALCGCVRLLALGLFPLSHFGTVGSCLLCAITIGVQINTATDNAKLRFMMSPQDSYLHVHYSR
jgi:hypothetical protein